MTVCEMCGWMVDKPAHMHQFKRCGDANRSQFCQREAKSSAHQLHLISSPQPPSSPPLIPLSSTHSHHTQHTTPQPHLQRLVEQLGCIHAAQPGSQAEERQLAGARLAVTPAAFSCQLALGGVKAAAHYSAARQVRCKDGPLKPQTTALQSIRAQHSILFVSPATQSGKLRSRLRYDLQQAAEAAHTHTGGTPASAPLRHKTTHPINATVCLCSPSP